MSVITDPTKGAQGNPPGSDGTGGQGNQDWRSSLPEDLRAEKSLESIKGKDWSEAGPLLAKSYIHAQRMVGAEKLVVPDDKATPEQVADFYKKLGRPEAPDKYTYQLPEGLKSEQVNTKALDEWRKELFEAGLTAKQADRIMSKYLKEEFGTHQAAKQAREKEIQSWELGLKQEFGTKYDEQVNFAAFALRQFGDKDGKLVKMLDDSGLGSHPDVVKFFANVGRKLSDASARGGGGGGFSSAPSAETMTPGEAQAALTRFGADEAKQKALFNTQDPRHEAVVKERLELFKAAFPKSSERS